MKIVKNFEEYIANNIIFKIIKWFLYTVVVLLLTITIVQRVTNNYLSVGGFRAFIIKSGSMTGEYEIGDILIAKSVPAEDINVGDNVTYLGKGELDGVIITHKVVEKKEVGDEVHFVTRGLQNEESDPEISYDQIYGKIVYKTIVFSFLAKLMNNKLTYYLLFALVALIISIQIVSAMFDSDDEEEEENDWRKQSKEKEKFI